MQQVNMVVVERTNEISPEDLELVNDMLPLDKLKERYNSEQISQVLLSYNLKEFRSNKWEYISLYFRLGTKYPGLYMKSALISSHGYWYVIGSHPGIFNQTYYNYANASTPEHIGDELAGTYPETGNDLREIISSKLLAFIQVMPVVSLLGDRAFHYWISLVCAIYLFYKKTLYSACTVCLCICCLAYMHCRASINIASLCITGYGGGPSNYCIYFFKYY